MPVACGQASRLRRSAIRSVSRPIVTKLGAAVTAVVTAAPRLVRTYRVRFDEAGQSGHLRSSGFLRFAQDLAWIHSESAGFGRSWYAERGLAWLVRGVELDILEDIPYGAEVGVSTEVAGFRRFWARRRSAFTDPTTGQALASAITDWVLLNSAGTPVRPPTDIVAAFPAEAGPFTPLRLEFGQPATDATRVDFAARASELDPMGHVNNATYIDYLEEHLAQVGREAEARRRPRRYRLEFVTSARAGMVLSGHGWDEDRAWCYRLSDADGGELLRARLATDPTLWVGG
jgi:acyl-ACP thioesterase